MSKIVYRLEDDDGYGFGNHNNELYDITNSFSEEEIHKQPFYSMIDHDVKTSLSKEELLLHYCAFDNKRKSFSLFSGREYNILELEISQHLPQGNSTIILFKKEHIISSKVIERTENIQFFI